MTKLIIEYDKINIFEEMRQNEYIRNAFVFLACAKRMEELEYVSKGFYLTAVSRVMTDDLIYEQLYSDEIFDEMSGFVRENSNYKYILMDFIKEDPGLLLPAFVGACDLKLGVDYQVREVIDFNKIMSKKQFDLNN